MVPKCLLSLFKGTLLSPYMFVMFSQITLADLRRFDVLCWANNNLDHFVLLIQYEKMEQHPTTATSQCNYPSKVH